MYGGDEDVMLDVRCEMREMQADVMSVYCLVTLVNFTIPNSYWVVLVGHPFHQGIYHRHPNPHRPPPRASIIVTRILTIHTFLFGRANLGRARTRAAKPVAA